MLLSYPNEYCSESYFQNRNAKRRLKTTKKECFRIKKNQKSDVRQCTYSKLFAPFFIKLHLWTYAEWYGVEVWPSLAAAERGLNSCSRVDRFFKLFITVVTELILEAMLFRLLLRLFKWLWFGRLRLEVRPSSSSEDVVEGEEVSLK